MSHSRQEPPLPAGVTRLARLGVMAGRLHRAAWSPDGRFLAIPGEEHRVWIVEPERGRVERELALEALAWSVAFSPDGRWLAAGQAAAEVALWDWQAGRLAHRLAYNSRTSAATVLFLDDETLVSGSGKGQLYVWDVTTGERRHKLDTGDSLPYALALRPDGDSFAIAFKSGSLEIWGGGYLERQRSLVGHTRAVYAAAWSPGGRFLASGSADSTVRLWNPETGEESRLLSGPAAAVVGISFSADGRLLAAKTLDGILHLWRTDLWQPVAEVPGTADARNPFGLLAFHPEEALLATAGENDRCLDLLAIDTERLLEAAAQPPREAAGAKAGAADVPPASSEPEPPPKPARRSVFVSYSRKDREWLERLKTMAAPLVRSGRIEWWDDSEIPAGAKWRAQIEKALATAKVAVLLVSPDFLDSHFINTQELPQLLAAAETEGLTLLWVHVRKCWWQETAIADYQAAHDASRPLAARSGPEQDDELFGVAEEIKRALAKS